MHNLPTLIESCSKDNSSLCDNLFCEESKNTSRRTLYADLFIIVLCCIYCQRLSWLFLIDYWADFITQSTINAYCAINLRIQKTFFVCRHTDTLLGAHKHTSTTSTTIMFFFDVYHLTIFVIIGSRGLKILPQHLSQTIILTLSISIAVKKIAVKIINVTNQYSPVVNVACSFVNSSL